MNVELAAAARKAASRGGGMNVIDRLAGLAEQLAGDVRVLDDRIAETERKLVNLREQRAQTALEATEVAAAANVMRSIAFEAHLDAEGVPTVTLDPKIAEAVR